MTSKERHSRNSRLWLALLAGFVCGAVLVWMIYDPGIIGDPSIRETIRRTGHLSFLFFLIPLVASPLHQLHPSPFSKRLLRIRPLSGLAFAGNHIWHLVFITLLYRSTVGAPEPLSILIGGSIAMFYLFSMALLSFPMPIRFAGQGITKWVHRLGFYTLLGAFFYDIVLRNWPEPNPVLITLLTLAILIRLVALIKVFAGHASEHSTDSA